MTTWLWALSKSHTWWRPLSPVPGEYPRWLYSLETRICSLVPVTDQSKTPGEGSLRSDIGSSSPRDPGSSSAQVTC